VKDPDEAGGVTTEEDGALVPLETSDGAASTPAAKTAGASTRAPRTPVEAKRSHDRPLRKKPPTGKSVTRAARPAVQGFNSSMQHLPRRRHEEEVRVAESAADNLGHAHWKAPMQALHHLRGTPEPRFTHAEVSSPLEGNPPTNGSTAVDRRAIFGRMSPTDGTTTPVSSKRPPTTGSGNVAATHG
jgi:hypothetical protein